MKTNINESNWIESKSELKKEFQFKDFNQAFEFIKNVAVIAEKLNHHPTWTNTWNKVEIILTTHDQQSTVTEKDFEMANMIDQMQLDQN